MPQIFNVITDENARNKCYESKYWIYQLSVFTDVKAVKIYGVCYGISDIFHPIAAISREAAAAFNNVTTRQITTCQTVGQEVTCRPTCRRASRISTPIITTTITTTHHRHTRGPTTALSVAPPSPQITPPQKLHRGSMAMQVCTINTYDIYSITYHMYTTI